MKKSRIELIPLQHERRIFWNSKEMKKIRRLAREICSDLYPWYVLTQWSDRWRFLELIRSKTYIGPQEYPGFLKLLAAIEGDGPERQYVLKEAQWYAAHWRRKGVPPPKF